MTDSKVYYLLSDLLHTLSMGRAGASHQSSAIEHEDFSFEYEALDVGKSLVLQVGDN